MNEAPNILLTNYCNSSCEYCFARDEMDKGYKKEMKFGDFLTVVNFLKDNNVRSLRLMGGEPTLYSRFESVIKIGLDNFDEIVIFTNGLMPNKIKNFLMDNPKKLIYNFNIDTPGYNNSSITRERVVKTIIDLGRNSKVNVGFTVYDLEKDYIKLLEYFPKKILKKIGLRFGYAKGIINQRKIFCLNDFKKIGSKLFKTIKRVKLMGVREISLDCGLEKKMFSKEEFKFLVSEINFHGLGCKGKWSLFDIASDLTIFPCFPYYDTKRLKLSSFKNIKEATLWCDSQKKAPCYKRS